MICTSTVTLRRADWEAAEGMDESLQRAEDYDLWLRLTRYGRKAHVLPDVLAVYEDAGDRLSADELAMVEATLDVLDRSAFPGFLEPTWLDRLGRLEAVRAHLVMKERGDFREGRRLALKAIGGSPRRRAAWTALARAVLRTKRG